MKIKPPFCVYHTWGRTRGFGVYHWFEIRELRGTFYRYTGQRVQVNKSIGGK